MTSCSPAITITGDITARRKKYTPIVFDPDASIPYGAVPEIIINKVKPNNRRNSPYFRITGILDAGDKRYAVTTCTDIKNKEKNGITPLREVFRTLRGLKGFHTDPITGEATFKVKEQSHEDIIGNPKTYSAILHTARILSIMTDQRDITIAREKIYPVNKKYSEIQLPRHFTMSLLTPMMLDHIKQGRAHHNTSRNTIQSFIKSVRDTNQGPLKDRMRSATDTALQQAFSNALLRNVKVDRYGTKHWDRKYIIKGMEETCCYCGDEADTADHVIPLSYGGPDMLGNIVPACGRCNSKKSNSSVFEYAGFVKGSKVLATALSTVIDEKLSRWNAVNKAPALARIVSVLV